MAGTNSTVISVLGDLFQQGRRPCRLLHLIGGIQGAVRTTSGIEFPTNVLFQLRTPGQNVALEGANAPTAETVSVNQATNVVQLTHEKVSLTYLGASDKTVTGSVSIPQASANSNIVNPRSHEFQLAARMETIQRDINYAFLRGVYAKPADPTAAALKTRGLLTCIVTNTIDASGDAVSATEPHKQYRGYVEALIAKVVRTNGFNPDLTWVLFCDDVEFSNIAAAYAAKGTQYLSPEMTVVGVQVRKIVTNMGTILLALEPDMPAQTLMIADLSVVAPVGLDVPGKGILFMEPLAKVGSGDDVQIYGQMGLDHGPEFCHGKLKVPAFTLQ